MVASHGMEKVMAFRIPRIKSRIIWTAQCAIPHFRTVEYKGTWVVGQLAPTGNSKIYNQNVCTLLYLLKKLLAYSHAVYILCTKPSNVNFHDYDQRENSCWKSLNWNRKYLSKKLTLLCRKNYSSYEPIYI